MVSLNFRNESVLFSQVSAVVAESINGNLTRLDKSRDGSTTEYTLYVTFDKDHGPTILFKEEEYTGYHLVFKGTEQLERFLNNPEWLHYAFWKIRRDRWERELEINNLQTETTTHQKCHISDYNQVQREQWVAFSSDKLDRLRKRAEISLTLWENAYRAEQEAYATMYAIIGNPPKYPYGYRD